MHSLTRTAMWLSGVVLWSGTTAPARPPAVRHVVIDTDVGPDDLMAIAFLLGRSDVRIDAITTVHGLTSPRAGARNVLRLLALTHHRDIPVYVGASEPLQRTSPFPSTWVDASEKQGMDAAPPTPLRPRGVSAARYLAGVLSRAAPRPDILALGPLTNLAQAIRLVGTTAVRPIRTVVMGGALDVPGNLPAPEFTTTNTKAEWNIFADPLAARETANSPLRLELVALDATSHVRMDTCLMRRFAAGPATPSRQYVARIMDAARVWIERGDYYAWDPLAAVAMVESGVVTYSMVPVTIDVKPPSEGWVHRAPGGRLVAIATSADRERFASTFAAALGPAPDAGARSSYCRPE